MNWAYQLHEQVRVRLEQLGKHELHGRLELLGHRPRHPVPSLGRPRVQVVDRVQVVVLVVPAEGAATCSTDGSGEGSVA